MVKATFALAPSSTFSPVPSMTVVRSVVLASMPLSKVTVGSAPKSPDTETASDAEPDFVAHTSTSAAEAAGVDDAVGVGELEEQAVSAARRAAEAIRGRARRTRDRSSWGGTNAPTVPCRA